MLALIFRVSETRYAIACRRIVEVIPLVELRPAPGAARWISGSFVYRGALTPVLDLCELLGGYACPPWLRTRIVITEVRLDGKAVRAGLMAEHVTEARHVQGQPLAGAALAAEPYLGELIQEGDNLLQILHPERIDLLTHGVSPETGIRGSLTSGEADRATAEP